MDQPRPLPPVLYVAGDIHLVGGGGPFLGFLDLLGSRPAARLVLLGDLFEYWVDTAACVARHADVLGRLRDLTLAGWQVDLVRGNRELAAGRRLEVAGGFRTHWPRLDVKIGGRSIRIVHGDRLVHDPAYRLFSAWLRSFWHRMWQSCFPGEAQELVARWLRSHSRGNQRADRSPRRIWLDRRKIRAAARGADQLVAGHIHESWRRMIDGVDITLVGDWSGGVGRWLEAGPDGVLVRRHHRFVPAS